MTQYITRRLRGEPASPAQFGAPIPPAAYRALLPTVWALINGGPSAGAHDAEGEGVLHAVLDHAVRVTSKSACKRLAIEFVARLMLVRAVHCLPANVRLGSRTTRLRFAFAFCVL